MSRPAGARCWTGPIWAGMWAIPASESRRIIDLPGGNTLELLDYQTDKQPLPEATANPGNVHLCLKVKDADTAWRLAVACGAKPIVPEGPVDIDSGPNLGAKAAYLRIHDGITLELFQPPKGSAA